jgi:peptidoglycan-N-acetylglucosamine deacetylase
VHGFAAVRGQFGTQLRHAQDVGQIPRVDSAVMEPVHRASSSTAPDRHNGPDRAGVAWSGPAREGINRRVFLAASGVALVSACAPVSKDAPRQRAAPAGASRSGRAEPESQVPAKDTKAVALTFDDGPDPQWTPQIVEILARHGITATFFMLGMNAVAHPDRTRAVAAAGHQVASHTWSHKDLQRMSDSEVRVEIERGLDAVADASGRRPTLFRAPYGGWSPAVLRICVDLAQRPIGWSCDPRDWDGTAADGIASGVLEQIRPGSIVLNHDGGGNRGQTVAALNLYLPRLLADGYRFVAL